MLLRLNLSWYYGNECFIGEVLGGLLVNSDREYFIYLFGNKIVVEEIKEEKKVVLGCRGFVIRVNGKSKNIFEDWRMC